MNEVEDPHQTQPGKLVDLFRSWRPPTCERPTHSLYVLYDLLTGEMLYVGVTAKSPLDRFEEHRKGSHNHYVREAFERLGGDPRPFVPLSSGRIAMWAKVCCDKDTWELEERRLIANAAMHGSIANRHRGGGSEWECGLTKQTFAGYLPVGLHSVELEWCGITSNRRYWACLFAHDRGHSYVKVELAPRPRSWWKKTAEQMRLVNRDRILRNVELIPVGTVQERAQGIHLNGMPATVESHLTAENGKRGTPNAMHDIVSLRNDGIPLKRLTAAEQATEDERELKARLRRIRRAG